MKTYKVVPYAGTVVLRKNELPQEAIVRYFDIINQECVDGWEFVCISPVSVTKVLGKFKHRDEIYQAFIFSKNLPDPQTENLDDID